MQDFFKIRVFGESRPDADMHVAIHGPLLPYNQYILRHFIQTVLIKGLTFCLKLTSVQLKLDFDNKMMIYDAFQFT